MQQRKSSIILGIGINDADYFIKSSTWVCPFYQVWISMLKRCYSKKKPVQYENTTVWDEWLTFSNFKRWMLTQDYQGKVLDKDLIGNSSEYNPHNCCFIYQKTNMFLSNSSRDKHGLLVNDKWKVRVGDVYLGSFENKELANKAYLQEKHKQAIQHAELYTCPRIKQSLLEIFKPL